MDVDGFVCSGDGRSTDSVVAKLERDLESGSDGVRRHPQIRRVVRLADVMSLGGILAECHVRSRKPQTHHQDEEKCRLQGELTNLVQLQVAPTKVVETKQAPTSVRAKWHKRW